MLSVNARGEPVEPRAQLGASSFDKLRTSGRCERPLCCTFDEIASYVNNEVMTRAKVSELKARLSAYLAEVRAGGEVLVCDRVTPIARLVPVNEERDDLHVTAASRPPATLKRIKGVRPRKPINVDKLLSELRQDR